MDPAKRLIFAYHNGSRELAADPLVVERDFYSALQGEDVAQVFRDATTDPEALTSDVPGFREMQAREVIEPANLKLVAAARRAFRLADPPADGDVSGTLTEAEALDLLDRFFRWVSDQKKGDGTSPSSSPPTPDSAGPSTPSTT